MAAEVDAPTFGELAIPREYTITQQGREYILSDGLLVGLVQLSRGFYDLATEIVQLPTAENAQTAVCTAKVTVFEPETGRVLRTATGIGDASPANVGRMVAIHCLRMAETRAVARALRHLLGVGLTALEELGQGAPETPAAERTPDASADAPVRPSSATPAPADVLAELVAFGVSPGRAAALVAGYPEAHIVAQLAAVREQLGRPGAPPVRNPAGYLAQAIEQGYAPAEAPAVRGPAESIQVDGRAFSRAQVLDVYHARLREADAAGLALAPIGEQGGPPPDDAPLLALVGFSQSIKRRLDARSGAVHADGAGGK